MTHQGIAIRLTLDDVPVLSGDSDFLYYCAKYTGVPLGTYFQAAAYPTCYGIVKLEICGLELPELEEELAELELGDVGQAAELAGQQTAAAADSHEQSAAAAAVPVATGTGGAAPRLGQSGAAGILTELPGEPNAPRSRSARRPGAGIARIARRALSLSGRIAGRSVPR